MYTAGNAALKGDFSRKKHLCIVKFDLKKRCKRTALHLYAYAGNNPVKYVDPDGRDILAAKAVLSFAMADLVVPEPTDVASVQKAVVYAAATIVAATITNSKTVRDKEGNPIPPANQSQSPLGKGANGGAEKLTDPGNLGEPGNIPPDLKGGKAKGAGILALLSLFYDNIKDSIPENPNNNEEDPSSCDAISGADRPFNSTQKDKELIIKKGE